MLEHITTFIVWHVFQHEIVCWPLELGGYFKRILSSDKGKTRDKVHSTWSKPMVTTHFPKKSETFFQKSKNVDELLKKFRTATRIPIRHHSVFPFRTCSSQLMKVSYILEIPLSSQLRGTKWIGCLCRDEFGNSTSQLYTSLLTSILHCRYIYASIFNFWARSCSTQARCQISFLNWTSDFVSFSNVADMSTRGEKQTLYAFVLPLAGSKFTVKTRYIVMKPIFIPSPALSHFVHATMRTKAVMMFRRVDYLGLRCACA